MADKEDTEVMLEVRPLVVRTLEDRPGPVFGLEVTESSRTGVTVSWWPGARQVRHH